MLQWFLGNKRKGVAWLLLFCLCFSLSGVSYVISEPVEAAAEELEKGLYKDDHDPINNVYRIYGRHGFSDGAAWTWNTVAFYVASGECDDVRNPPTTPVEVKTAQLAINQNLSRLKLFDEEKYTESTYVISGIAFANAFQALYQNEIDEAAARGERTYTNKMYFNSIFQVVYRTATGAEGGYYDDMELNPEYSFFSKS